MNKSFQPEQADRTGRDGGPPSVSSGPMLRPSASKNVCGEHVGAGGTRSMQRYFAGHVTRTLLLTVLLPLSFASLFGALIVAARLYPATFDWRVGVISKLTSPYENPPGCWLAVFGIMAAMLLILPFAGYVAQRLRAIAPRLAGSTGTAFASGFVLMFLCVALQLAQPVIGLRWLHGLRGAASARASSSACSAAAPALSRSGGGVPANNDDWLACSYCHGCRSPWFRSSASPSSASSWCWVNTRAWCGLKIFASLFGTRGCGILLSGNGSASRWAMYF